MESVRSGRTWFLVLSIQVLHPELAIGLSWTILAAGCGGHLHRHPHFQQIWEGAKHTENVMLPPVERTIADCTTTFKYVWISAFKNFGHLASGVICKKLVCWAPDNMTASAVNKQLQVRQTLVGFSDTSYVPSHTKYYSGWPNWCISSTLLTATLVQQKSFFRSVKPHRKSWITYLYITPVFGITAQ